MRRLLAGAAVCVLGWWSQSPSRALPPDVRSGHWAARAVDETLQNGVMSVEADHKFHGEAKVTRTQAAIALAKLAQALETGRWRAAKSAPVPDSVEPALAQGAWKHRPVTRYILATLLARFGDYVSNGVTRAPADSADTNKSEILPDK